MPVAFVTVPDVELVSTGTYMLSTGPFTFTAEDLAAAVAAASDPTVPAPRVKLGHTDPRFDEAVASGQLDGEPAFGTVANMRLSDDGQTVLGDLMNVPEWLAASMPSAYPSRSIEGGTGFQAASGRSYEFVISALALLGTQWPGVTSLPDLQEILEANGQAPEDAESLVTASGSLDRSLSLDVAAGLDVDLIRRRFVEMLDTGSYDTPDGSPPSFAWWPRSLRAEDGSLVLIADADSRLYSVPVTVSGTEVTFGEAAEVAEEYVPVASVAASSSSPRVAVWSREPRAAGPAPDPESEDSPMNEEQRRIMARALGLPEDTAEARLHEVAAERAAEAPAPVAEPVALVEPVAPVEPAPTPVIPEGMTLVDAETLQTLQRGAESGLAVAARLAASDREQIIDAAIRDRGRIAAAARDSWVARWEHDPEGTRTLLTADVAAGGLPDNVIPVGMREIGRQGDGEGEPETIDAAHDEFMARYNPQTRERLHARGNGSGVRVRQEV